MSDAGEPIEPKKKLSRKAHLKALADERRKRGSASSRGEEQDPDYRPVPPVEEIEEGGVQMEVEEVGAASQREDSRQRKRLSRERVRGVSSMAGAMEHFLMQATPTEFSREKARRRLCADVAGLRETVPLSLSQDIADIPSHIMDGQVHVLDEQGDAPSGLPVAPLFLQRRWARISRRYMEEYRKGCDGSAAIRAVKAHARHRDPNDSRVKSVEAAMAAMY